MTDCMASMLAYFWKEKGDIERWVGFNRETVAERYPEFLSAWDNYVAAKKAMDEAAESIKLLDPPVARY